jgi:hypothetical protein
MRSGVNAVRRSGAKKRLLGRELAVQVNGHIDVVKGAG